ncbi:hypothetical protein ABWL24_02330 [Priestia megaterium]|uniref:hypothetical protein n=1 Tax=Priestia megaterium TaxID=1404 RepID=UPI003392D0C6
MAVDSLKSINKNNIAHVYLIHGVNAFMSKKIRDKIVDYTLNEEDKEFILSLYK